MTFCIHKQRRKTILKGYIWCDYFRKVYKKDTCKRCRKTNWGGRHIWQNI